MDNAGIAGALREVAALLALVGASRFKVRAYERGARAVDALAGDVAELARASRLQAVPGIGPTLARTIVEKGWKAMDARVRSDQGTDLDADRSQTSGRRSYPVVGAIALVVLAVALWRNRRAWRGARIAAREARLEPTPVVY